MYKAKCLNNVEVGDQEQKLTRRQQHHYHYHHQHHHHHHLLCWSRRQVFNEL